MLTIGFAGGKFFSGHASQFRRGPTTTLGPGFIPALMLNSNITRLTVGRRKAISLSNLQDCPDGLEHLSTMPPRHLWFYDPSPAPF